MFSKKQKIVITDCDHLSVEIERKILKDVNLEFVLGHCHTENEVIEVAHDADGIINQYAPITRRVIESLKRCKVIARYGVGVDNIDVEAATEHGIIVANVKIREKRWNFTLAKPLFRTKGKTLGLFGLGQIARAVAQKASGFGFKIIAYDPYVPKVDSGIRLVEFSQLLSDSDFVSIHVPLTAETRHSFGENELKTMKKTAYLVNTARGSIVDEKALYKALKNKWIASAAFYSEESYIELKTKVAEAVCSVLKGKLPRAMVNSQVIKR